MGNGSGATTRVESQLSAETEGTNYLFDALIAGIHAKPLQWHLIITVGQPGDSTDDATLPWPPGREQVDAGTLTIDHVESEDTSPVRDINFDPLVLPNGITGSDDPLLSARSAAYAQSFTRREGEHKESQRSYNRRNRKVKMTSNPAQFTVLSRILHWLMAVMLLAMLFIGVAMVASLGNYHRLVAIHRPLGIMILVLAIIRLLNRMFTTLPPFPPTMSAQERFLASASERLLYALMLALPLVGWGMLSAGHYPIVMFGRVHLPAILPANPLLYAVLRKTHTVLAYLLFATFLAHLSAVLFHTLIVRDRLLNRMAFWPVRGQSRSSSRRV